MSAFLAHLAARARGTLPRLEPRRPAPFESVADGPDPDQPTAGVDSSPSPALPEAPKTPPSSPSPQAANAPPQAARIGSDAVGSAPTRAPVSATPAPMAATRRMAAGPPPAQAVGVTPAPTMPTTALDAAAPHAPPWIPASSEPAPLAEPSRPQPVAGPETTLPETHSVGAEEPPRRGGEAKWQPDAATEAPAFASTAPVPVPAAEARAEPGEPLEPAADPLPERAAPGPLLEPEPTRSEAARPDRLAPKPGQAAAAPPVPTIEVHIGAIDIVGEIQQPAETPPPAEPVRGIGLDDYLDGTGRG